jgi:hypothetical protein
VPIMLSSVDAEPRVMATLMVQLGEGVGEGRKSSQLSRWLGKSGRPVKRSAKECFWAGGEHVRRFLRGSIFPFQKSCLL